MSQNKLAETLGTSQKSVLRYEKALRLPSEEMLEKMADLFELSIREGFGELFEPPIRKWSVDRHENGRDIALAERLVQYAMLGGVSIDFLVYGMG
ncbi:helix-turn-helix domain-containing protein [Lactococcus garvieae]|uniref:helix-turn-helix domain-containing protein n=1 Tax=Lactococcus garvieae TaxID=1363 RepID=UPI0015D6F3F9|nr:helix-turn-helix transcriptional regulator [Lactococcus garvieae]